MPDLAGEVRLLYLFNLFNQKEIEYSEVYESCVMFLMEDNNGALFPNNCGVFLLFLANVKLQPFHLHIITTKNNLEQKIIWHIFCSLSMKKMERARGYRTTKNLITMIYLISGKLHFNLPT